MPVKWTQMCWIERHVGVRWMGKWEGVELFIPACMVGIYILEINSEIFRYREGSVPVLAAASQSLSLCPQFLCLPGVTWGWELNDPPWIHLYMPSFQTLSPITQGNFYKHCHLKASKQNIISAMFRMVGDFNRLEIRCWNLHSNKNLDE